MTDNGSAYRSHLFKSLLASAGLRHIRTRPYTPRTNGKAERFIQTSLREWAYATPTTPPPSDPSHAALDHTPTTTHDPTQPSPANRPVSRLNNVLGFDS